MAAGFGITTLPRLAVPVEREDVAFIPTSYDGLRRTIAIITSAGHTLSPAVAAFVDAIDDAF